MAEWWGLSFWLKWSQVRVLSELFFVFILFCVEESGHLLVLRKLQIKESFTIFSLTPLIEWKCSPEDFNQRIWKAKFDKILSFLKFKEQEKSSSQKYFPFLWKDTQSLAFVKIKIAQNCDLCIFFQNGYSFDSRLQWMSSDYQS